MKTAGSMTTRKGNGAIFTCAGFSVAVLWSQYYVYVFDSDSRNSSGFHDSNGKAILLKFCSVNSLNNYLNWFYYSMVSIDTQYDLKYVGIEIVLIGEMRSIANYNASARCYVTEITVVKRK